MGLIWSALHLIPQLLYTPQRMVGTVCMYVKKDIFCCCTYNDNNSQYHFHPESLRLLSLHDNKYLRYFKGHHDRHSSLPTFTYSLFTSYKNHPWAELTFYFFNLLELSPWACVLGKITLSQALLIELCCSGTKELINVKWDMNCWILNLEVRSLLKLFTNLVVHFRVFYAYKEDQLQLMMTRDLFLQ